MKCPCCDHHIHELDLEGLKHIPMSYFRQEVMRIFVDASPRKLTMDQLIDLVYGHAKCPDGPKGVLSLTIWRMNNTLAEYGWVIKNDERGRGCTARYHLSEL